MRESRCSAVVCSPPLIVMNTSPYDDMSPGSAGSSGLMGLSVAASASGAEHEQHQHQQQQQHHHQQSINSNNDGGAGGSSQPPKKRQRKREADPTKKHLCPEPGCGKCKFGLVFKTVGRLGRRAQRLDSAQRRAITRERRRRRTASYTYISNNTWINSPWIVMASMAYARIWLLRPLPRARARTRSEQIETHSAQRPGRPSISLWPRTVPSLLCPARLAVVQ